ncbi:MAG: FlgD immunoglobulin-like domain containing protein [Candidatus Eisenbacteria bacterium]
MSQTMWKESRRMAVAAVATLCLVVIGGASVSRAALPGIEADGDLRDYEAVNCKAIDAVYDDADPVGHAGDIMAFYADQGEDRLVFRVGMFMMEMIDGSGDCFRREGTRIYVLVDYEDGGTMTMPDGVARRVPIMWDTCVRLGYGERGAFEETAFGADLREVPEGLVRASAVVPELHTLEGSIELPDGFRAAAARAAGVREADYGLVAGAVASGEATPVRYHVVAVVDGEVVDELSATNEPRRGDHNVAFAQHGNQGLTYTTVFWGEKGENASYAGDPANPDDGFDELLDAHDYYDLPGNFHMAGTLITGAEWHDPAFNDSLVNGVGEGWVQMLTSAYAQHIMPFVYDDMNSWSVYTHRQLTNHYYGQWPTVAWVPERVWLENPDSDDNGIDASCCVIDNTLKDDFYDNDVDAVILDDYVHCADMNGAFDDHHVYVLDNGLKVLPMDNDFNGQMGYDAGAAMATIWGGTSDEIILYGNDWEVAAEVAGFDISHPSALNNYIYVLQQCSTYSDQISVWKLDDVITSFPTTAITLQNGTYGLLGEWYGYGGGCNDWYCNWASYVGEENLDGHDPKWGYQGAWQFAHDKVVAGPSNDLSESAWYVMMSMLHETGWHDAGEIAGWEHRYSNHIKNANPYSEAALWAEGLGTYASNLTGCSLWDIDEDGRDEAVIWNDRVMAVFETIGGKANWIFAKGSGYGYSVVGNDNVYWAGTSGDWNETNHTAALSDVSVGGIDREHDDYAFEVVSASGSQVELKLTHGGGAVEKRVRLSTGDPYLDVIYDVGGETAYIKSGWTPDLVDLIWDPELYRVWDPGAGSYCGQRNTSSGATAALVLGAGGAGHNVSQTATLLEIDEIVGTGQFEFYVYAGYASAPVADEIAELEALSAGLTDVLDPRPVVANYYPSADRLDIAFNEIVQYDTIVKTGIAIDEDDDGVAEVTLTTGATVMTTGDAAVIQIQVASATAAAIEALNPGTLELLLAVDSFFDVAGNGNEAVDNTDDVRVIYGADTKITIDGLIDLDEWAPYTLVVDDPDDDSGWHPPEDPDMNEFFGLYADWDEDFLYLGMNGQIQGNSWLLYLDTDPGGPLGQTDLTAIDAWERGATFTAAGFKADFQYGCYQHQSAYDSDSFFSIDNATTTTALTDSVISAFDSFHLNGTSGGSELAIPWNALYGLGAGAVPPNASFSLVASICWDSEPDGELGGDSVPSNSSATLPVLDSVYTITIDHDGDGVPDEGATGVEDGSAVDARGLLRQNHPNPFNPTTRMSFVVGGAVSADVLLEIFDVRGARVATLADARHEPGEHSVVWDGVDSRGRSLPSGVYFAKLTVGDDTDVTKMIMLK